MGFYENLRDNTAAPLIQRLGQPITLYRTVNTVTYTKKYDPLTMQHYWEDDLLNRYDSQPAETQAEYTGFCVVSRFEIESIDNTFVSKDDLLVTATGIPRPEEGDIVLIDGVTYNVVNPMPVSPAGIDVVQKFIARV